MAKFHGKVGYGQEVETASGIWETQIIERIYYGDEVRNFRRSEQAEKVNNDLTTSTAISIVSDSYANERFFAIRYVEWAGTLWEVNVVERQSPRLILGLGGKYNGPTPTP